MTASPSDGYRDEYRYVARLYDAITEGFLRSPRRELVLLSQSLNARRILDTGCGTGVLAGLLTEHADLVIGMDRSAAMLASAAKRAESRTAPGRSGGKAPRFVRADALRPPFTPSSFDLVIISLLLHECPDPEDILRTSLTLAPRVLVLEWRMPERNLDLALTAWVRMVERLAGRRHYSAFRRFMKGGGIRGLAARAGARIITESPMAGNSLVLTELEAKTGRGDRAPQKISLAQYNSLKFPA